jgi:hypothetical protein
MEQLVDIEPEKQAALFGMRIVLREWTERRD